MANEENLVLFTSDQSREEAKKNGSKGGRASGAARRRKKAMKQAASALLNMGLSGATGNSINIIRQRLISFGMSEEDATFQDAMLVGILLKALKGDVSAAAFLRDVAGENPMLALRKEELKLKRAEHDLKKQSLLGGEKDDRDENNLLDAIKGVEEVDTSDLPEVE